MRPERIERRERVHLGPRICLDGKRLRGSSGHSISRTMNNATSRFSQLSAILLHQEQAGEIAKPQLPCVCMPLALVQPYRAHLIRCPLPPNIGLASLAAYEQLPGDRLAGTGNPCQAT